MTACVNKHSKRVALAISASLVGALSLGAMAPVAAFAEDGIQTLASPSDVWDGIEFSWSVEPDATWGTYTVQAGDQFMLTGASDAFGNPVSMSDLTVVYFKDVDGDGTFGATDTVWTVTPDTAGDYKALVIDGRIDTTGWTEGATFGTLATKLGTYKTSVVSFSVEAKSLEGAFAYQDDNVSDTSFKYTGNNLTVNFADASGNKLTAGEDYTVSGLGTVTNAGTYVATLEGIGEYSGSTTVTFTVDKIDLAKDTFTIDPSTYNTTLGTQVTDSTIKVNGEPLNWSAVGCTIVSAINQNGKPWTTASGYDGKSPATVTVKITAATGNDANFVDSTASANATWQVVQKTVNNFYYDGEPINLRGGLKFETAKGESFDPSLITAALTSGGKSLPLDVTVTKNGKEVTSYSEPGTYNVTVDVKVPADLEYAGSTTFQVTVIARRYSEQPKAFIAVDGKDASTPVEVEYDGKAVEPAISVKSGSATLAEGTDYTVSYKDASGKAVESIVEPGEYTGTIDFGDAVVWQNGVSKKVDNVDFTFTVTKAKIRSAKADKDVYAYSEGQAVAPIFTAYSEKGLEGLSLTVDPAKTAVTYHTYTVDADGNIKVGDENLKASDLTEEGWYVADVNAPADDPHFTGSVQSEPFQISKYAAFSDVAADAWYAQDVYNAAKLSYMTGIKGTALFMPEADISRAELAKVFSNMAGRPDKELYTPTAFGDVDAWAWYAEPIAWASEAGIVTGYQDGSGNFGPNDKATREQVALMVYRYAAAQGKDMSVDDADAALSAYSDGDEVSDWAKTAMAWCVENGVFGVGTDELRPQDNILRAQVAAISVRIQPEALPTL